mgnify:CR=1 FL=1
MKRIFFLIARNKEREPFITSRNIYTIVRKGGANRSKFRFSFLVKSNEYCIMKILIFIKSFRVNTVIDYSIVDTTFPQITTH